MPLEASQFVLPGIGGNVGDALSGLSNKLWMRNMQMQRLGLAQEGKREQAGNFLREYLDPKEYLTGTEYDPIISQNINAIMQHGADLAAHGADIPQLLMALGPQVNQLNQYSSKAKIINKQIDDNISKLRESGAKYNYGELKEQAKQMAFHAHDPKTDQDIGLNAIGTVDPTTNYVEKVLQQHPDLVTSVEGIREYAKNSQQTKTLIDRTHYNNIGTENRDKVYMVGQNWLTPDYDAKGKLTELVPKHDIATENGNPIQHTYTNEDGKDVTRPVRLLDEGVFNDMVSDKWNGDYIRGQVMKHLKEYKDRTGQDISLDSPQARMVARSIAYDELYRNKGGGIQETEVQNKPSGQQIRVNLYGGLEQQAKDRALGTAEGKAEAAAKGYGPTAKINTVDALHRIANNDPEMLHGPVDEKRGRAVMDVTNMLPGGKLNFGSKHNESYQHVYYDPQDHTFLLQRKDGSYAPNVGLKDMPNFLNNIANPNHVPGGVPYVQQSLQKYGYANGTYNNMQAAPDFGEQVQQAKTAKVDNLMDEVDKGQDVTPKEDIITPMGKVTKVVVKGNIKQFFGSDPYEVHFVDPEDKKKTDSKTFKNRAELDAFLKQSTLNKPSQPAKAEQTTAPADQPKKDLDSYIPKQ